MRNRYPDLVVCLLYDSFLYIQSRSHCRLVLYEKSVLVDQRDLSLCAPEYIRDDHLLCRQLRCIFQRRLKRYALFFRTGGNENIIAVIGDGSLSGGEAFEGLDFVAELGTNMIIIVNDNQMSIAENHGGLYKNLKELRDSNGQCECNFFKAMGLDYMYVNDGNDVEALIEAFSKVKDIQHPIVVHINTLKGKGYERAEQDKETYHWRAPFNIETGEAKFNDEGENYSEVTAQYLLKKMKEERNQTYTIQYDKEKESVTLDLDEETEGWVSIGNFYLPQGEVIITLTDKVSGDYVIADAVKFTATEE